MYSIAIITILISTPWIASIIIVYLSFVNPSKVSKSKDPHILDDIFSKVLSMGRG